MLDLEEYMDENPEATEEDYQDYVENCHDHYYDSARDF